MRECVRQQLRIGRERLQRPAVVLLSIRETALAAEQRTKVGRYISHGLRAQQLAIGLLCLRQPPVLVVHHSLLPQGQQVHQGLVSLISTT